MKNTRLTPFHDNIILSAAESVEQIGSIIVPEAHRVELCKGVVLDKGPMVSDSVKIGDTVFFAQHSETRLALGGKKFRVVTESNCLGSLREVEIEDPSQKTLPLR